MKIIFFGTPSYVEPILEKLSDEFTVVGVVTTPDQKTGRHQTITPSPVKEAAQKDGVPVFSPEKLDSINNQLSSLNSDLIVVASYGKIIPQAILDIPKFGALNVHPSLLPKYRGATPIQSAILNGDSTSGITIIKMDKDMDHGPIVYQEEYHFTADDTFESLAQKMFTKAAGILVTLIPDFVDGKVEEKEQNHDQATFCNLLKKEDGYFDIENPPSAEKLDRMIRAYYPWPNAWTKWRGKVVKLYPGGQAQMEGKKPVKLADFLNGYPDFPIKQLLAELRVLS